MNGANTDIYASNNIPLGSSASSFKDLLNGAYYFYNYEPSVSLTTYDAAGIVTSNATLIKKYVYRLTFARSRAATDPVLPYGSAGVTFVKVQQHTPPLSGSYELSIDGIKLPIWSGSNWNQTILSPNTNSYQI